MIFTDRTIIVQKGTSSINDTIILYRGDKGVEIRFSLNEGSPFRFGSGASPNIIEKTEAAYGQLIIKRPNDLPAVFSEIAPTNEGKIVFTITAEMIDEITEVGNYTFQIRLLDESRNSRATLPEVVDGIEIREPIDSEDRTNVVGLATVGYALTTAGAPEDAFDSQGNYNKTTWAAGDRITDTKLNKMEDGIDEVNRKVANVNNIDDITASATTTYSSNKIENIREELSSQIKDKVKYPILDNEVGVVDVTLPYGNVRRYGARGDYDLTTNLGTDDTQAFKNAILSNYNEITIPQGKYLITDTLKFNNQNVKGNGVFGGGKDYSHSSMLCFNINKNHSFQENSVEYVSAIEIGNVRNMDFGGLVIKSLNDNYLDCIHMLGIHNRFHDMYILDFKGNALDVVPTYGDNKGNSIYSTIIENIWVNSDKPCAGGIFVRGEAGKTVNNTKVEYYNDRPYANYSSSSLVTIRNCRVGSITNVCFLLDGNAITCEQSMGWGKLYKETDSNYPFVFTNNISSVFVFDRATNCMARKCYTEYNTNQGIKYYFSKNTLNCSAVEIQNMAPMSYNENKVNLSLGGVLNLGLNTRIEYGNFKNPFNGGISNYSYNPCENIFDNVVLNDNTVRNGKIFELRSSLSELNEVININHYKIGRDTASTGTKSFTYQTNGSEYARNMLSGKTVMFGCRIKFLDSDELIPAKTGQVYLNITNYNNSVSLDTNGYSISCEGGDNSLFPNAGGVEYNKWFTLTAITKLPSIVDKNILFSIKEKGSNVGYFEVKDIFVYIIEPFTQPSYQTINSIEGKVLGRIAGSNFIDVTDELNASLGNNFKCSNLTSIVGGIEGQEINIIFTSEITLSNIANVYNLTGIVETNKIYKGICDGTKWYF